jgi:hypothetical protein
VVPALQRPRQYGVVAVKVVGEVHRPVLGQHRRGEIEDHDVDWRGKFHRDVVVGVDGGGDARRRPRRRLA